MKKLHLTVIVIVIVELVISSAVLVLLNARPAPVSYIYEVVNVYPHDQNALTQGLVFEEGVLYESTGLHGKSTLHRVKLETGEVIQLYSLPS